MLSLRILGCLLVVAGTLKLRALAFGLAGGEGRGGEWLVGFVELPLGLWMVSGLWPTAACQIALPLFAVFFGVAAVRAFLGEPSCGCFPGVATVSPVVMAVADLGAVLWLWLERHPGDGVANGQKVATILVMALLGLGVGLTLEQERLPIGGGNPLIPAPETWVGGSVDELMADLDAQGGEGSVFVMIHRTGCSSCAAARERYFHLAERWAGRGRFVLAEIPSDAVDAGVDRLPLHLRVWRGTLRSDRQWEIATPQFIWIKDGVVSAVTPSVESFGALVARGANSAENNRALGSREQE